MQSWRRAPVVFLTTLFPGVAWLALFFLAPLGLIALFSLGERTGPIAIDVTGTLQNYGTALDPLYLGLFVKTLWIAGLSTLICLVVGFPIALALSFAPPRVKPLLLVLIILPFWTNLLIRTFAMIAVLRGNGYANKLFEQIFYGINALGALVGVENLLGERFVPFSLLYNNTAVIAGIVYVYLPFMILPLYASLERLDRQLIEASLDLGASQIGTFFRVIVPLAKAGIVSGLILVFVPALGTFLIPDLLGGPNSQMIGNVIERQFKSANNWPLGSAMSLLLMILTFAALTARAFASGRRDV